MANILLRLKNRILEIYETATGKLVTSSPVAFRKGRNWSFYSVEVPGDGNTLFVAYCGKLDAFDLRGQRKLFELDLVCKERFSIGGAELLDSDVLRVHPNGNLLLTFSDKTGSGMRGMEPCCKLLWILNERKIREKTPTKMMVLLVRRGG